MTTMLSVPAQRASISTRIADGHAFEVLLVNGDYTFSDAHTTADDLADWEITGGGYERYTLTGVAWNTDGAIPAVDADDAAVAGSEGSSSGAWVADAEDSTLLWWVEFGDTIDLAGELPIEWDNGQLAVYDEARDRTLAALADVDLTTTPPANLDSLMFDAATGKWRPGVPAGTGGGDGNARPVGLMSTDFDAVGGEFETVPGIGVGDIPRAYLVGAPILVVTPGDNFGVWTVPEDGPCTPGDPLRADQTIFTIGFQGLEAIPKSMDGVSVIGFEVQPTSDEVDAAGAAAAAAGVAAAGAAFAAAEGKTNAAAALLASDLMAEAVVSTPPIAWLECGRGPITGPDPVRGYWACPTALAAPTTKLRLRHHVRINDTGGLNGDGEQTNFHELRSEPMDGGGTPGEGGVWDRFEAAIWAWLGRLIAYFEWTAVGGSSEWHSDGQMVWPPMAYGMPFRTWFWVEHEWNGPAGTITTRVRVSAHWDYQDPDDGTLWRTLETYNAGGPVTFAASVAVEQWIGRGGGLFDIARSIAWVDDTLASDPDIAGALDGATTVADTVLGDDWTARDDAVVRTAA